MDELQLNREFFQNRKFKSFIKVGLSFIDIKQTIGFSFINDPEGYIVIQFVYDTGRVLNAFIKDRNEFAQFFLELDPFIDDKNAIKSINDLIVDIETTLHINEKPQEKPKRKYKKRDTK